MTWVEGIDVSHWQVTTPPLTGRKFLVARASIGLLPDDRYNQHIAAARRAGLVPMAYHFGDNRIDPVAQARLFLDVAGQVGFYFLDVEGAHAMTRAQRRAFHSEVRRQGHESGYYHSLSGFTEDGQDSNWIAFWSGSPPPGNWLLWQYRGSPLDLDRFIGTEAQLRGLAEKQLPDTGTEAPAMGMINTTILPYGGRFTIPAKATFEAIRVGADGKIVDRKTWLPHATDRTFPYDAVVVVKDADPPITGNPFVRPSGGDLLGFLVSSAQVVEVPNSAPVDSTPFSQADVDREVARSSANAVNKAIDAVINAAAKERL